MPARHNVFAPLFAALFLAALGGVVARGASTAAAGFHARLNIPRPPLGAARPMTSAAPAARARRVFIVVIDGLRLDRSFGHPWLDGLRRSGVEGRGRAHFPTYSLPNQVAVLTGVTPLASGVRNNAYRFPVALDSLMDRARAGGLQPAYVANRAFDVAIVFNADFEAMHYVPWAGGMDKALRLVVRQGYPLVVVVTGAVDEAGHQFGADSREYAEAIVEVDRELAAAFGALDLDRDAILVVADHGHLARGGHGGTERDVTLVPFIMAGAGVRAGAALGDVGLVDVAPTAAALLGLPPPGHGLGRTLTAALDLGADERERIERDDRVRQGRNEDVLRRADAAAAERARDVRHGRLIGIGIGLFAVGLGLVCLLRVGAIQLDLRVLLIGLPAFPLTYYALLLVIGGGSSLSAIPDRAGTTDLLVDFGLVATGVQIAISWFALHDRRVLRERLAAATGLTLCGLLVSWIPAGILWALYDPASQPVLASSRALVLAPATWIAVAFFALASAVTLALEIIVFLARGLDPRVRLRRLERAAERARAALDDGEGSDG